MFSKNERATFKYTFAHWCAFQMTALNNKLVSNENKYVNEIRKMYEIDDSRYYILVNNFYEKMSEKIKKIGLI